jgi:hypothetical protein
MNAALKTVTAGVLCWTVWQTASALPDVHISEDRGFIDIDLPIAAVSDNEGLVRITARGSLDDRKPAHRTSTSTEYLSRKSRKFLPAPGKTVQAAMRKYGDWSHFIWPALESNLRSRPPA